MVVCDKVFGRFVGFIVCVIGIFVFFVFDECVYVVMCILGSFGFFIECFYDVVYFDVWWFIYLCIGIDVFWFVILIFYFFCKEKKRNILDIEIVWNF